MNQKDQKDRKDRREARGRSSRPRTNPPPPGRSPKSAPIRRGTAGSGGYGRRGKGIGGLRPI